MPVLEKSQPDVKRYMLPSGKHLPAEQQGYVDLNVGKLAAEDFAAGDDQPGVFRKSAALLAARIDSWNFTAKDGTPLPVNVDTVLLLDMGDFTYLNEQFEDVTPGLSRPQKKD